MSLGRVCYDGDVTHFALAEEKNIRGSHNTPEQEAEAQAWRVNHRRAAGAKSTAKRNARLKAEPDSDWSKATKQMLLAGQKAWKPSSPDMVRD